jgi:cobalt/nickel transport system permease protein
MFIKQYIRKIPHWMLLYYGLASLWLSTTAMHIPDGYLSPVTCIIMVLLVLPFWIRGVRKLRQKMTSRNIPLVALLAAFSFVIMMFNIPIPGGTTAHAVGGALAAIILGPEIATLAVSIALLIQAVFFGDGGILSFGANCFNMAVVLPYASFVIYQWISGRAPLISRKRVIGAAVGAWVGLTTAAFFAGVEFGIQPALWHTANGTPLYAPYPLSMSIPAMVIPHALIASVVEGLITALVVVYLQKANLSALEIFNTARVAPVGGRLAKSPVLWVVLAVLIFATPLGLFAPGSAWGEWGTNELNGLGFSFIPQGMQRLAGLWSAPLSGYDLPALKNVSLGYIFSALAGVVIIAVVAWLFTILVTSQIRHLRKSIQGQ